MAAECAQIRFLPLVYTYTLPKGLNVFKTRNLSILKNRHSCHQLANGRRARRRSVFPEFRRPERLGRVEWR